MKKVLLIVNPVAGKKKAKSTLFDVISTMQEHGMQVTVMFTEHRSHAKELAATAAENGFEMVVCFGGDGTLNETICGLMESDVQLPLGYIPAGSTNDFAKSMKLSSTPKIAAKNIAEGTESIIDIGLFNNERYFTYVAAFGIFTATSYNVSQGVKNVLGHLAYILGGVKEITKIRSYHVKLILDDEKELEDDYIFAAVANSTSVAGIVKLDETLVDMSDGVFEIGLIKKPKNIIELKRIVSSLTTSNFNNGGVELLKASKIKVITENGLDWTLDGEHAVGGAEVVIENKHKAVNFIKKTV